MKAVDRQKNPSQCHMLRKLRMLPKRSIPLKKKNKPKDTNRSSGEKYALKFVTSCKMRRKAKLRGRAEDERSFVVSVCMGGCIYVFRQVQAHRYLLLLWAPLPCPTRGASPTCHPDACYTAWGKIFQMCFQEQYCHTVSIRKLHVHSNNSSSLCLIWQSAKKHCAVRNMC